MGREVVASWNGVVMPLGEVQVPVTDRAYMFGDGVYEVVRIYAGRPFALDQHLRRLSANLEKLGMSWRFAEERVDRLLRDQEFCEGYLYVQISRMAATRQHVVDQISFNELVYADRYADDYLRQEQSHGVSVMTTPDIRWSRCDIKTTNLLPNTMAKAEAQQQGHFEAVFVAEDGSCREGCSTNLFAVRKGVLVTPPLDGHVLPGVTRELVIEMALKHGLKVSEERLVDLDQVEEAFLTGTSSEIIPIIAVDGKKIGAGVPGGITRSLQLGWRELTRPELAR